MLTAAAMAVPAGVALVVGLHFFPLARLYDQWQYRWTAALLTAAAARWCCGALRTTWPCAADAACGWNAGYASWFLAP
ncbi:hypothetical protein SAFG77S_02013 [Streptomyces afghaniensis]